MKIEYNSNITYIPNKALDIWQHFEKICIGVSLDGINKINNYIRYPSKWEKAFNSLRKYTIEEILNHNWFKKDLLKSFSKTMKQGKLMTCGRTCGEEYKFSSGDKNNSYYIKL